jgi:hypothetical protein
MDLAIGLNDRCDKKCPLSSVDGTERPRPLVSSAGIGVTWLDNAALAGLARAV